MLAAISACSVADASGDGVDESNIINGAPESGYAPAGYLVEAAPGTTGVAAFGTPVCSAVLIAPKVALTAAHCLYAGGYRYAFGVGVGSARRFVEVADAYSHPDADRPPFRHDLAVLTLRSEVAGVTPASVAEVGDLPSACALRLVGYGVSRNVPRKGADAFKGERRGSDLCVTSSDGPNLFFKPAVVGRGIPCFGDSGGALMISGTNKVVGIQNNVFWAKDSNVDKGCFAEDEQGGIRLDSEREFLACAQSPDRRRAGAFPDSGCSWSDPFLHATKPVELVQGDTDGAFHPGRALKRSELAVLLTKAFRLTSQPGGAPFRDVPTTHWAAAAVSAASAAKFLTGYPDGTFNPDAPITHTELVVALVSGLKLAPPSVDREKVLLAKLVDRDDVPTWARAKVATGIANRIVLTEPAIGYLDGNTSSSRALAVAAIYQAMLVKGLVTQPISSPYIVAP